MSDDWQTLDAAEVISRWRACGYEVSFVTMPHSNLIRAALSRMETHLVGDGETMLDALAAVSQTALMGLPEEMRALWMQWTP